MLRLIKSMSKWAHHVRNTLWLLSDKGLALFVGFFVTAYVARIYGPEDFGLYSYCLALVSIFSVAGHAGLNALVVKRLVDKNSDKSVIMGTSIAIKACGFSVGLVCLLLYAFYPGVHTSLETSLIGILCLSLLIQPGLVLDFWFQAQYAARYQAISKHCGLLMASAVKLFATSMGASILWIAGATVLQSLVVVVCLVSFYFVTKSTDIGRWRFDTAEAKSLAKKGGVVFLGTFFATVYLKIDQVMLKTFVGSGDVGVYAVAATISEAIYFIPIAITAALFPRLVELRDEDLSKYKKRTQQLLDGLAMLATVIALVVTFVAAPLILLIFGDEYSEAAKLLAVHIWASVFIFMRSVFSKWIIAEDLLRFSIITHGAGAVINVVMNSLLIPSMGAMGAAIATLVSYAMASYLVLMAFPSTRPMFFMMSLALFSPVRYGPRLRNIAGGL